MYFSKILLRASLNLTITEFHLNVNNFRQLKGSTMNSDAKPKKADERPAKLPQTEAMNILTRRSDAGRGRHGLRRATFEKVGGAMHTINSRKVPYPFNSSQIGASAQTIFLSNQPSSLDL